MNEDARVIEAMIEIPVGSRTKYEYDAQLRALRLDRVLYGAIHYPASYGFVPHTLADDGDPLDVLVLGSEPVVPGCYVRARVIGLLQMHDRGQTDDKLVAVLVADPLMDGVRSLADVSPHYRREIETFFRTYKDLEGGDTEISGWQEAGAAVQLLASCRQAYEQRGTATRPDEGGRRRDIGS